MEKALTEIIRISHATGGDSSLVQGGGGNTSVKTPDGKYMYIKASGTALKEMSPRIGWRKLKLDPVLSILRDGDLAALGVTEREAEIVRRLHHACADGLDTDSRPSVESVLHALLGRCVIHLHPTAVEAYVCARGGKIILERLFKDQQPPPLWIPYADPGYSLAKRILKLSGDYKEAHGVQPSILFLEKHGLFVTTDNPSAVIRLVHKVINRCNSKLNRPKPSRIKPAKPEQVAGVKLAIRQACFQVTGQYAIVRYFLDDDIACFMNRKDAGKLLSLPGLTPDELVYSGGPVMWLEKPDSKIIDRKLSSLISRGETLPAGFLVKGLGLFITGSEKSALIAKEVIASLNLVRSFATRFGGLNPLNKRQRTFIYEWEAESFRKNLVNSAITGEISGRIAVVTGAGSGIGRSIAIGLARARALVAVADIDRKAAAQTCALINKELPDAPAITVPCDVTAEKSVDNAIRQILNHWGGLDILVNAAGIAPAYSLVDLPVDKWRLALEINLTGYFLMAQAAVRIMIEQAIGGSIINISSKSGLEASRNNSPYNATKAGEIHLARGWTLELGEHKIRVNSVAPGNVFEGSKIWNRRYIEESAKKYGLKPDEVIPYYIKKTALKREIRGQDIADVVVFLCSDKARTITGQTIVADSGQVMVR